MIDLYNAQRLTLARESRGLFRCELAKAADLSVKVVGEHESGKRKISSECAEKYAKALNFPLSFFEGDVLEKVPSQIVNFRALSKMSVRNRDKAIAGASIIVNTFEPWLQKKFTLPSPDVPDFDELINDTSPEELSFILRLRWGLGEKAIQNMVHLVEAHGVRVYTLPESHRDSDAFSFWWDNVPYIFFDNRKTAERARFDIAHELGHLVMHRALSDKEQKRDKIEKQANQFASYFLMPSSAFLATAQNCTTLLRVIQLKKCWNVSVLACLYRLKEHNIISDWLYRQLNKHCSMQGRSNEPEPSAFESSRIIPQVMKILYQDGIKLDDVARDVGLDSTLIRGYIFDMDTLSRFQHLRLL